MRFSKYNNQLLTSYDGPFHQQRYNSWVLWMLTSRTYNGSRGSDFAFRAMDTSVSIKRFWRKKIVVQLVPVWSDWASYACLLKEYVNNLESLNILLEIYLNLCQSYIAESILPPYDCMDIKTDADLFTRWSALINELGS